MSASEANEYDYVYVSEYHNNTNITLNWTESFHESDDCIAHFYVPGYVDWTQIRAVHVVFVALYLIVMVLAICGNSMVIWTVWRHKSMHTATNYYITSLAVSDFFVSIFVLPFKLMECAMDASISPFRNSIALCSVMSYMQPIFVFASIWTLVSVSIDRYLAIMHPLKARSFGTKSRARKIIIAIWTIGCLLMAPFLYPSCLYFYTLESDYGSIYRIICTTQFHDFGTVFVKGWHIFLMLILYFVPLTVLCLTYGIMAARLLRMTKNDKMVHAKDFQRSKQSKSRRK
ncbi:cholecystokinin receptor type A-like, partial [Saccoglossus kowalevskii]